MQRPIAIIFFCLSCLTGSQAWAGNSNNLPHRLIFPLSAFVSPTADASNTQTEYTDEDDNGSEEVSLDASNSSDADGTIESYVWTENNVEIATGETADVELAVGVHNITLTVTDDDGDSDTDNVVITITEAENQAPTANAGQDQSISDEDDNGSEEVSLDASNSSDADGTIESYVWTEGGNQIATGINPDVTLDVGVHNITLTVTDDDGDSDTDNVVITITEPANTPPTADASNTQTEYTDEDDNGSEEVSLDASNSSDADGTIESYVWTENNVEIATGETADVELAVGVHNITLTVTDDDGDSDTDNVVITITEAENQAPTANAGQDQSISDEDDNGSEEVSLDASNSSDADGTIESYVWTEGGNQIATGINPDVTLNVGVHNITLTVTDDDGDSDTDNVVITITEAENQAPTANAGQDQSISDEDGNGSEEVSLDASNSSDADGTIESYVWTEGGNQIATGETADVELNVGVHNITLTVTDDDGDSDTDNVVITITEAENQAPTADAGQDQSISDEDDNGSESVELDGSGSSDADGTIESYVWTENNVEIATGETADVDLNVGVHNITLTVTDDDEATDTDNVVITITEAENQPPTADAGQDQSISDEDGNGSEEVTLNGSASSDADGTITDYVWTEGGNQIATGETADVELAVGVHNITLTVTDDDGDSDTDNVVITITEAENQAPTANAGQDQSISDEDDNGSESVELDGSGSSDDDGTIESYVWTENNVEIATGETADVDLNVGVHNITLTVTDDDGDSDTDNVVITITEPANTPPTADASNTQTEYTDEDDNGSEEVSLDASNSSDADGTIESYVWTEGGNQIATGINPDVTLDVGVHNITLTVTDDDGDSDTDNVVITITEAENQAPTADAGQDQSISDEDDNGSESVELDGSGSSDDDGTIESYVWTENNVEIATGETADVDLNVGVHNITLTVTDDDGDSDTDNVVITITEPANTPPTADASNTQTEYTDEDDNGSEEVSLDASNSSDADGTIESYVWTEGGNQIATGINPDVTLDVGVHNITLTVTDDDGDSDTDNVVITITEAENQAPTANAGQDQSISDEDDNGSESVELDGSGSSDADGTITDYVWTEGGNQIATGETADVDLNVGVHNITLTVTDDDGDSDTDNVVITITEPANTPPTADASNTQTEYTDEDDNGSEEVSLDASNSSDADGTIESYVWTEGGNQIATGETADVDLNVGVHNITLTVTDDDGDSDTDNVVITITEAENQAPTANAGQDQSISDEDDNGSESVELDGSGSSDDDGTIESYVWTENNVEIATGETADVDLNVGVHNITLTVTDDDGDSDTDNVVITITEAENQAPTADAGQDQSISDEDDNGSESVELDGSGSSDDDGTIESYVWTENNVEIATGETADVDLNVGVHNITLTVTDDDGDSDTDNVVITITEAENQPPTANAGQDQSISDEDDNGSEEVGLDASNSSDADGTIESYVWTEGGNQIATGETADVELAVGVHNITLTVTDDDGDSDTDNVVITITEAENQAPTADAGQDQSISDEDDNGSESVELDGSGSSDADGTIESYVWTENNVEIATGETADVDLNVGVHNITLTVTDDDEATDTDNVVITITEAENQPPTADAGQDQSISDEDGNGSEEVTLNGSASSDADGTITDYVWTEGGNQIATGETADVELAVGVHNITLTVTDDDGDSDTDNVVITITEAENQAPTANAGQDQSISDEDDNGSESVELDGSGSSDDDGTIESYVWTENNVEIATGETADVDLNVGVHNITLTVTDDDGDSDTDNVVITITEPANTPPTADASNTQTEYTDEDDNGSEEVSLDASNSSDADGTIESYVWTEGGNQIATGINPDVTLDVGVHNITLTVTDDDGDSDTDNVVITITEAENQAPTADAGQDQSISDEDDNGSESVELDGSGSSDDDGTIESYVWTENNVEIATGETADVDLNVGVHNITLTVTDDDGDSDTDNVVVVINEPETQTPFFSLVQEIFEANEDFNSAVTVAVQPDDESQEVSYSILPGSIDFATLTADNSNGIYEFESLADRNGEQEFTITATAEDDPGNQYAQNFTFRVNAVNDQPVFNLAQNNVNVEAASGARSITNFAENIAPGPATATDEASQTLAFTATATDQSLFAVQPAISNNGTLTFTPADDNIGSTAVEVILTDSGPNNGENQNSSSTTFTFAVTEQPNAEPEAEPESYTFDEDNVQVITLEGFDEDNDPLTYYIESLPINGTLTVGGVEIETEGEIEGKTVTYTPNPDYNGTDAFTFAVSDGTEPNSNVATIGLNIDPVNDAPTFTIEDDDIEGEYNAASEQTFPGFASEIEDVEGQELEFILTPADGNTLTFTQEPAIDAASGDLTFVVANNSAGIAGFTVVLSDGDDESSLQSFTIVVQAPEVEAPSNITLTPNNPVDENDEGAFIGDLSAQGTQPISFSLPEGEANNELFTINNGNELFTNGALDFETVGASLTVVVQATNGNGNTTQNFDIEVTNEEEPPTSISLDGNTIEDGDASGTTVGTLSAQGGAPVPITFSLTNALDNSNFSIQNDNQLVTAFTADYDSKSSYQVEVQAQGDGDFEQTFNISVNPPVIVAPTTITLNPTSPTVAENDENALVGTLSADGTAPISFSLTDAEDNDFFTINGNQLFVDGSLDFETVGASLTVVVQATNGNGNTTQNFDIEVTNEEEPPTSISLDGNTIEDGDASGTTVGTLSAQGGASETVTFSLPEGEADNSNFSIQNDNQLVTAFTADYDSKSSYQVEVQAQGDGDFEQTFNISVNPPVIVAPTTITLNPTSPTVAENDENALVGTLSADGTAPISFSLTDAEDNDFFTINGNQLFVDGSLDFETVGASLTVVVQATNGNGNTTQNFDIEVTNEEEPPTSISLDGNTIEDGDASGTTVGTLSAQGGASETVTFSLPEGEADNSNFSIQNDNQLVTAFTADYDSKSSYQVEVQAQGDGDFEQTFNISVNPPVIVAPTTITLNPTSPTVAENDENALVGTLSADGTAPISFSLTDAEDNDFFTINGNQLFVDGSLDFETVGASLTVVVQATNGNGNTTQNFDIEVTNEEEPPTSISLDGNTIEDGDASGTTVGTLSAQGGASETVTFSLPEGEADNSNFSIQNDNQLVTAFTADYDSKSSYQVEVQAQGDGDFEQTFNISVNPPVIVAPTTITLNPTSPTVAENDENALVGTLSADGTAPISFSLTDAEDNDFFTINGNQLFVDGSLDFETVGASLTVVVQATNGDGNTTQNFDIEVTNEEEPPTSISLDGNTIEDGDASGTTVGTLSAQGGASETVTFSLPEGEADNSNFSIQNDNQLVTAFTADYDSKSSYQVEVQAQGDGDLEQTFNISVNPAPDPVFTLDPDSFSAKEDFEGIQTITIVPAEGTPAAEYSFEPQLSTIDFVDVSFDAENLEIIFQAVNNAFGSTEVLVTATDPNSGNTVTNTLNIAVNSENDNPTVSEIPPVNVTEDDPDETITLSDYFSDVEDATLDYAVEEIGNESLLTATIDETTAVLTISFNENASGNTSITVSATDDGGLSATATIDVQISGSNDAPVISDQNEVSTDEDVDYQILLTDLIVEDADNTYPAGFTLTIGQGDNYEIVDGTTISPTANYNGELTVEVQVTDPEGASSNPFDLSITVEPVNDAPVASTIEDLEVEEDAEPVSIDLAPYFSDIDNETLTYSVVSNTSDQITTDIDNASLQLSFETNFSGNATLNIQASDGETVTDPNLSLQVVVIPVNDAPVLSVNEVGISGTEDTSVDLESLLSETNSVLTVTDPDSNFPDDFFIEAQDLNETNNYTLNNDRNSVIPAENFDGDLFVPIRVNDGNAYSTYQTLRIRLNPVNDRPQIFLSAEERGTAIQFNRGDSPVSITSSLIINDVDNINMSSASVSFVENGPVFYSPDEDELRYPAQIGNITGQWDAENGVLSLTGNASINDYRDALRSITYFNNATTPTALPRQLLFVINDGALASNEANDVRFIRVEDSNLPPELTDFDKQVPEDESLTLRVSDFSDNYADDLDPFDNAIYITRLPDPSKGSLVVDGEAITDGDLNPAIGGFLIDFDTNPSFSYQPETNFNGTDSFEWTALDSETQPGTLINSASVSITVLPVSDPPTINAPASITASEDAMFSFSDTRSITIEDIDSTTDSITVSLAVQEGLLSFVNEGVLASINFLDGSSTDTPNMTFRGVSSDIDNALTSLQYAARSDFNGTDILKITATDPQNNSAEAEVNIIINSVNDLPALVNMESDTLSYTENDAPLLLTESLSIEDLENDNIVAATISITENFAAEEDRLGFTPTPGITGRVSNNRLILTGNASIEVYQSLLRSITYENMSETPQSGVRKINFQVTDVGNGSSNIASRYANVIQTDDSIQITDVESTALAYRPGDAQQILTESIILSDADDDSLTTAIISFSNDSYIAAEDSLIFESDEFEVSWNEEKGTLTINGENSIAEYQNALRAVQYINTSDTPTPGSRLIRFTVFRNGVASNVAIREITIIINEPPLLTDFNLALLKNSSYSFSAEDFANHYNDPDNSSENLTFVRLRISKLPSRGQLLLSGEVITQEILDTEGAFEVSTENINQLTYQPESDYVGADSIEWNAFDGEAYAIANAKLTFNITDLTVNAGADVEVCLGDPLTLNVEVSGGSGNYTYTWTCDQADCMIDNANAAEVSVSPGGTTAYFVKVTDENGITSNSDTIIVNTIECYGLPLSIPTAFTPNGDGPNDSWVITNIETYDSQVVEVYDRYGKQVYFSEGYQRPWDGSRNGQLLPAGTYYYLIKLNGGEQFHRGSVSILK